MNRRHRENSADDLPTEVGELDVLIAAMMSDEDLKSKPGSHQSDAGYAGGSAFINVLAAAAGSVALSTASGHSVSGDNQCWDSTSRRAQCLKRSDDCELAA